MAEYKIPDEYFFRIHHVRPRFKGDIENVLIYMAEEISRIGECETSKFVQRINAAIYNYPGNAHRELKTINNWRTEISALFGFIEHTETTDKPGLRAIELAENQDLVECFKVFLYNFQYPGAHIKPKNVLEQVEAGVHFKPAQYILKLLRYANKEGGNSNGITKFEACHCVFNDLRVTRDNEGVEKTWERILENRKNGLEYDQTGDVVRYAGDIIDYMEIANLLKTYDSRTYYLNTLEEEAIVKFCESTEWFAEYDEMIEKRSGTMEEVKECVAVPKSKKLLQFTLDDGTGTDRTILSGIHAYYEPEELVGKTLIAITNLPPRKMMGIESCGMLLSAVNNLKDSEDEELHLLMVDNHIPAGAKLY